ncbi:MAG: hypothetical protein KKD05_00730 [Candidatus Omnitrophica bacterium]|nr:hypothetical protein [Candidatus Omnitrophota bacterium]
MRDTRKLFNADFSKSTFVYCFHKDTFFKVAYMVLICYLFFISIIMLVDALREKQIFSSF